MLTEEDDRYLTSTARTPEGQLLIAILENTFAELGGCLRRLKNVRRKALKRECRDDGWIQEKQTVGGLRQRLHDLDNYIGSNIIEYGSITFICQHVFENDEFIIRKIRQEWAAVKARGYYTSKQKRVRRENKPRSK